MLYYDDILYIYILVKDQMKLVLVNISYLPSRKSIAEKLPVTKG